MFVGHFPIDPCFGLVPQNSSCFLLNPGQIHHISGVTAAEVPLAHMDYRILTHIGQEEEEAGAKIVLRSKLGIKLAKLGSCHFKTVEQHVS